MLYDFEVSHEMFKIPIFLVVFEQEKTNYIFCGQRPGVKSVVEDYINRKISTSNEYKLEFLQHFRPDYKTLFIDNLILNDDSILQVKRKIINVLSDKTHTISDICVVSKETRSYTPLFWNELEKVFMLLNKNVEVFRNILRFNFPYMEENNLKIEDLTGSSKEWDSSYNKNLEGKKINQRILLGREYASLFKFSFFEANKNNDIFLNSKNFYLNSSTDNPYVLLGNVKDNSLFVFSRKLYSHPNQLEDYSFPDFTHKLLNAKTFHDQCVTLNRIHETSVEHNYIERVNISEITIHVNYDDYDHIINDNLVKVDPKKQFDIEKIYDNIEVKDKIPYVELVKGANTKYKLVKDIWKFVTYKTIRNWLHLNKKDDDGKNSVTIKQHVYTSEHSNVYITICIYSTGRILINVPLPNSSHMNIKDIIITTVRNVKELIQSINKNIELSSNNFKRLLHPDVYETHSGVVFSENVRFPNINLMLKINSGGTPMHKTLLQNNIFENDGSFALKTKFLFLEPLTNEKKKKKFSYDYFYYTRVSNFSNINRQSKLINEKISKNQKQELEDKIGLEIDKASPKLLFIYGIYNQILKNDNNLIEIKGVSLESLGNYLRFMNGIIGIYIKWFESVKGSLDVQMALKNIEDESDSESSGLLFKDEEEDEESSGILFKDEESEKENNTTVKGESTASVQPGFDKYKWPKGVPYPFQADNQNKVIVDLYTVMKDNRPVHLTPKNYSTMSQANGGNVPTPINEERLQKIIRYEKEIGKEVITKECKADGTIDFNRSTGIIKTEVPKKDSKGDPMSVYFICSDFWCEDCKFPWYINTETPSKGTDFEVFYCGNGHENSFWICPGCKKYGTQDSTQYKGRCKTIGCDSTTNLPKIADVVLYYRTHKNKYKNTVSFHIIDEDKKDSVCIPKCSVDYMYSGKKGDKEKDVIKKELKPSCYGNPSEQQSKYTIDQLFSKNVQEQRAKCLKIEKNEDLPISTKASKGEELKWYDIKQRPIHTRNSIIPKASLGTYNTNLWNLLNPENEVNLKDKKIKIDNGKKSFFRVGIKESDKHSFLELIAVIYKDYVVKSLGKISYTEEFDNKINYEYLIDKIVRNNLKPSLFTKISNGKLIQVFVKKNKPSVSTDVDGFKQWINEFREDSLLRKLLPKKVPMDFEDKLWNKSSRLKNLFSLYDAYVNCMKYLLNKDVVHTYNYLWEIFVTPGVLFPYGIELFIFEEITNDKEENTVQFVYPNGNINNYYRQSPDTPFALVFKKNEYFEPISMIKNIQNKYIPTKVLNKYEYQSLYSKLVKDLIDNTYYEASKLSWWKDGKRFLDIQYEVDDLIRISKTSKKLVIDAIEINNAFQIENIFISFTPEETTFNVIFPVKSETLNTKFPIYQRQNLRYVELSSANTYEEFTKWYNRNIDSDEVCNKEEFDYFKKFNIIDLHNLESLLEFVKLLIVQQNKEKKISIIEQPIVSKEVSKEVSDSKANSRSRISAKTLVEKLELKVSNGYTFPVPIDNYVIPRQETLNEYMLQLEVNSLSLNEQKEILYVTLNNGDRLMVKKEKISSAQETYYKGKINVEKKHLRDDSQVRMKSYNNFWEIYTVLYDTVRRFSLENSDFRTDMRKIYTDDKDLSTKRIILYKFIWSKMNSFQEINPILTNKSHEIEEKKKTIIDKLKEYGLEYTLDIESLKSKIPNGVFEIISEYTKDILSFRNVVIYWVDSFLTNKYTYDEIILNKKYSKKKVNSQIDIVNLTNTTKANIIDQIYSTQNYLNQIEKVDNQEIQVTQSRGEQLPPKWKNYFYPHLQIQNINHYNLKESDIETIPDMYGCNLLILDFNKLSLVNNIHRDSETIVILFKNSSTYFILSKYDESWVLNIENDLSIEWKTYIRLNNVRIKTIKAGGKKLKKLTKK
jgi:hypothetical protein